jgi:hypothetical protein
MTRWMIVVPLWIVGAIVALQSPVRAQTDESPVPASLERIRAALEKPPPRLRLPAPSSEVPTFRVEISQRLSLVQPLDEEPFDPTWGLPSAGELLMGGIDKIRSAAVNYKRRRNERRARREVQEALAAFCAVHECPPHAASR